jgi:hypothetical protein
MTKAEYLSRVNPEFCGVNAFAEWVRFSDSFPPLSTELFPKIRFYEVLFYGLIKIIGMYIKEGDDKITPETSKFFKNITENEKYWGVSYWRYLPPPPDDNIGYIIEDKSPNSSKEI